MSNTTEFDTGEAADLFVGAPFSTFSAAIAHRRPVLEATRNATFFFGPSGSLRRVKPRLPLAERNPGRRAGRVCQNEGVG